MTRRNIVIYHEDLLRQVEERAASASDLPQRAPRDAEALDPA